MILPNRFCLEGVEVVCPGVPVQRIDDGLRREGVVRQVQLRPQRLGHAPTRREVGHPGCDCTVEVALPQNAFDLKLTRQVLHP